MCIVTMPPYYREFPKTLYIICLQKVKQIIELVSLRIEGNYGSYDSLDCQYEIKKFQKYLLSNIPGILFDDLCEVRPRYRWIDCGNYDLRIVLSIHIHKNMRKFSTPYQDSLPALTPNFWQDKIMNMPNIVKLDLDRICSDELLKVVGDNCSNLEEIRILPRLIGCKSFKFNALKLTFSLSNEGLVHLSKCKRLKKIRMNRFLRSVDGVRNITTAGIRRLIKSLPNIQFVNYESMGSILAEDMDDIDFIPFTNIIDNISNPKNIKAMNRLCTNLQHLTLKYIQNSLHTPNEILKALSLSDLRITTLDLQNFPFCEEMVQYLKMKGSNLISFCHTGTGSSQSSLEVNLIGHYCPSITQLQLLDIKIDFKIDEKIQPLVFTTSRKMFTNLEFLKLSHNEWPLDNIIPICLTNATKLEKLCIYTTYAITKVMAKIIEINPFTELQSLHTITLEPLRMDTLKYFYKNCTKLTDASFGYYFTCTIFGNLKTKNYDLEIPDY